MLIFRVQGLYLSGLWFDKPKSKINSNRGIITVYMKRSIKHSNIPEQDSMTSKFYEERASMLALEYAEAAPGFTEIFKILLPENSAILDAGCGSGRDLASLSESGFNVTGADSSSEMITAAEKMYPQLKGRLKQAVLPLLTGITGRFDGILCSGVLQHIQDKYIHECFSTFSRFLLPGGICLVSFPVTYPDIHPHTKRDINGRLFIIRTGEHYKEFASVYGLILKEQIFNQDSLGRPGTSWGLHVYQKKG